MKFLCVKCDEAMKLVNLAPPERGSLSVVYSCPSCSHQIAMLTNPYETQVVQSLGVKIGPGESAPGQSMSGEAVPGAAPVSHAGSSESASDDNMAKCPFSGMVQGMIGTAGETEGVSWSQQAEKRLENMPEFARPMARVGIEKFASDNGYDTVDEAVMDQAKDFFGM